MGKFPVILLHCKKNVHIKSRGSAKDFITIFQSMRLGSVCMLAAIPIMFILTLLHNFLFDPGFDQVTVDVKKTVWSIPYYCTCYVIKWNPPHFNEHIGDNCHRCL